MSHHIHNGPPHSVGMVVVQNIPNQVLRHVRLPYNQDKPVTNSRDTQEVQPAEAAPVLDVFFRYRPKTSLLDEFDHLDRQEEEAKRPAPSDKGAGAPKPDGAGVAATAAGPASSTQPAVAGAPDVSTVKKANKPQSKTANANPDVLKRAGAPRSAGAS